MSPTTGVSRGVGIGGLANETVVAGRIARRIPDSILFMVAFCGRVWRGPFEGGATMLSQPGCQLGRDGWNVRQTLMRWKGRRGFWERTPGVVHYGSGCSRHTGIQRHQDKPGAVGLVVVVQRVIPP